MFKPIALFSQGIKRRLLIAFSLVSIIPILLCLNFIFPSFFKVFSTRDNIFILLLMFFIVCLGFIILNKIIDSIVKLSQDAKKISLGDTGRKVQAGDDDEIGSLASTLNQLAFKIKEGINELEEYASRTAQVNLDIQKRIVVMSNLLQITNLIGQGEELDSIFNACLEKLAVLEDCPLGFILFLENKRFNLKAGLGIDADNASRLNFSEDDEMFKDIFSNQEIIIIDSACAKTYSDRWLALLKADSFICMAVFVKNKPAAVIGVGSFNRGFEYNRQRKELMYIFSKQIAVAIENHYLAIKVKNLEIKDALTGLYNERYIRNTLDKEIKRAVIYQRPCGFVLLKIADELNYKKLYGKDYLDAVYKDISAVLSCSFSGIECLGRFGGYGFALILPEKNKRQAENTANELAKKIEHAFISGPLEKMVKIKTAVSENPVDGISADELIAHARGILNADEGG